MLMDNYLVLGYLLFVSIILSYSGILMLGFPKLEKSSIKNINYESLVSIIIPTRNEADSIKSCIESILNLDYHNTEIIVVDGGSTDKTKEILQKYKKYIKIINEPKLPSKWIGKNWACHVGYQHSIGDLLLFTDADTIHSTWSLSSTVNYLKKSKSDLLSLYPKILNFTFWEKFLMPPISSFIVFYTQGKKTNDDNKKKWMANGQYILIKKETYEKVGGHKKIKERIYEEYRLAELIKKSGYKIRLLHAPDALKTRMYSNFKDIWEGFQKNSFAGMNYSLIRLISFSILLISIHLFPFIFFIYEIFNLFILNQSVNILWSTSILSFTYVWMFIFYKKIDADVKYVIIYPLSIIFYIGILFKSAYLILSKKGVTWKNRTYNKY